jgi:hypothetical protein
LVVVSRAANKGRYVAWRCRCDCGSEIVTVGSLLRGSVTQSCGCLRKEVVSKRRYKHGKPPEYRVWANMKERCTRPANNGYADYGGRGITVCARWADDFGAFLADMGPRPTPQHTIDRIDNDGNYEPGNCRWATKAEQAFNRRSTVVVVRDGTEMALTAYARAEGICDKTLWYRHRLLGESLDEAVAKIKERACI